MCQQDWVFPIASLGKWMILSWKVEVELLSKVMPLPFGIVRLGALASLERKELLFEDKKSPEDSFCMNLQHLASCGPLTTRSSFVISVYICR